MIKKTADYGKGMQGKEIWWAWCRSMAAGLEACLPDSAASMIPAQASVEPEGS